MSRICFVFLMLGSFSASAFHVPKIKDAYLLKKNIEFIKNDQGDFLNFFQKKTKLTKDQIFEIVDIKVDCQSNQHLCSRVLTLELLDCGVATKGTLERTIASASHYTLNVKDEICRIQVKDKLPGKNFNKNLARKSSFHRLFKWMPL